MEVLYQLSYPGAATNSSGEVPAKLNGTNRYGRVHGIGQGVYNGVYGLWSP